MRITLIIFLFFFVHGYSQSSRTDDFKITHASKKNKISTKSHLLNLSEFFIEPLIINDSTRALEFLFKSKGGMSKFNGDSLVLVFATGKEFSLANWLYDSTRLYSSENAIDYYVVQKLDTLMCKYLKSNIIDRIGLSCDGLFVNIYLTHQSSKVIKNIISSFF